MRKTDAVNAEKRVIAYNLGYGLQSLNTGTFLKNPYEDNSRADSEHVAYLLGVWDCRHGIDRNPESVRGNYAL